MKNKQPVLKAFVNAANGLKYFFLHEQNGKIQLLIACTAITLAIILKIDISEWVWILVCTAMVLSLEMLNSALEKLCDVVQPEFHPLIKIIKDVSAAAVLWAAIISAVIGILIFLPKLIILF